MNLEDRLKKAIISNTILDIKGVVFDLGNRIVAKAYLDENLAQQSYEMTSYLFENNINVPQAYDVKIFDDISVHAATNCREEQGKRQCFLFMQYIQGYDLRFLKKSERKKALEQYCEQLEKILNLNIVPYDADWIKNVKYDTENGKLYFLDFDFWKKESKEKIDAFRSNLPDTYVCFRYFNQVINMRL